MLRSSFSREDFNLAIWSIRETFHHIDIFIVANACNRVCKLLLEQFYVNQVLVAFTACSERETITNDENMFAGKKN